MKNTFITLDIPLYGDLEQSVCGHFDNHNIYRPHHNVSPGHRVYILPSDNDRYIFPAFYTTDDLNGDVIDAVILCTGYMHQGRYINFNRVVGLKAQTVDEGGNNYKVQLFFRGGDPVAIPTNMLREFDLVI